MSISMDMKWGVAVQLGTMASCALSMSDVAGTCEHIADRV